MALRSFSRPPRLGLDRDRREREYVRREAEPGRLRRPPQSALGRSAGGGALVADEARGWRPFLRWPWPGWRACRARQASPRPDSPRLGRERGWPLDPRILGVAVGTALSSRVIHRGSPRPPPQPAEVRDPALSLSTAPPHSHLPNPPPASADQDGRFSCPPRTAAPHFFRGSSPPPRATARFFGVHRAGFIAHSPRDPRTERSPGRRSPLRRPPRAPAAETARRGAETST